VQGVRNNLGKETGVPAEMVGSTPVAGGMTAGSSPTRISRSPIDRAQKTRELAKTNRAAKFGKGLTETEGLYGAGTPTDVIDAILSGATAQRIKAEAFVENELKLMDSEHRATAAAIGWFTDIDQQVIDLQEQIALARGIPIPWSNFAEENSESEYDIVMNTYRAEESMRKANFETSHAVVKAFYDVTSSILGDLANDGKITAAQGKIPYVQQTDDIKTMVHGVYSSKYGEQLSASVKLGQSFASRTLQRGEAVLGGALATAAFFGKPLTVGDFKDVGYTLADQSFLDTSTGMEPMAGTSGAQKAVNTDPTSRGKK
jgi:hypothetical protein